jgi:3-hydroxy acid dehydrogenase/malonic semialdehyde reductase
MKLENKIAFITGATSGIGRSCAFALASEGAKLILCARRMDRLEEISKELKTKYNTKVHFFKLDVRSHSEVKKAVAALPQEWKAIDILVNNAGLAKGMDKIHEGDVNDWDEMIDTNVKGLLYVSREVIPGMAERKKGHIVNIGSIAGHEVYPKGNVYCASKYAVNAISQGMRQDLIDTGVKVTSIDPGMVKTAFSEVRFSGDKERAENVYKGIDPLTPDDIADAVLYCVTRQPNMVVNDMILTPLFQANAVLNIRK